MTIVSMIDYFYHARDILTGPWDRDQTRGRLRWRSFLPQPIVTVGTELTTGLGSRHQHRRDRTRARPRRATTCARRASVPDDAARRGRPAAPHGRLRALWWSPAGSGPRTTTSPARRPRARWAVDLLRDETRREHRCGPWPRGTATPQRAQAVRQADVHRRRPRPPRPDGHGARAGRPHGGATLVLLPGPPAEMRPAARQLSRRSAPRDAARRGCAARASPSPTPSASCKPRHRAVRVSISRCSPHPATWRSCSSPETATPSDLPARRRGRACARSATRCYSTDGSSLAETVVRLAHRARRAHRRPPSRAPAAWSPRRSPTSPASSAAFCGRRRGVRERGQDGGARRARGPARAVRRGERGDRACDGRRSARAAGLHDLGRRHRHRRSRWRHRRQARGTRVVRASRTPRWPRDGAVSRISPATAPPCGAGPRSSRSTCCVATSRKGRRRASCLPRHRLPIAVRLHARFVPRGFCGRRPRVARREVGGRAQPRTSPFASSARCPNAVVPLITRSVRSAIEDLEPYRLRLGLVRAVPRPRSASLVWVAPRGAARRDHDACRAHRSRHVVPRVRARRHGRSRPT